MNYWLLSITPENFQVTRSLGFTVQGFSRSERRKVAQMAPGDRLLFYIRVLRRFAATATVTSRAFEDRSPLWTAPDPQEVFPHRVQIKGEVVLPEEAYIDAGILAPRMDYLQKWPPERWLLAFLSELHIISKKDFAFIEGEMKKALRPARRRGRAP